jgi:hypothetical protein
MSGILRYKIFKRNNKKLIRPILLDYKKYRCTPMKNITNQSWHEKDDIMIHDTYTSTPLVHLKANEIKFNNDSSS